ncbi:hypothetical protein GWK47_040147 [Chionoecetes opilio]|uniref:Uncharacterized protein n=1 Tax=Chionoecetes opilio TaxID=41210 RepID=A0A8J4YIT4_CHIOP|nr:hypothetical protein GWK47_040147 [Chionoecetes opilio]
MEKKPKQKGEARGQGGCMSHVRELCSKSNPKSSGKRGPELRQVKKKRQTPPSPFSLHAQNLGTSLSSSLQRIKSFPWSCVWGCAKKIPPHLLKSAGRRKPGKNFPESPPLSRTLGAACVGLFYWYAFPFSGCDKPSVLPLGPGGEEKGTQAGEDGPKTPGWVSMKIGRQRGNFLLKIFEKHRENPCPCTCQTPPTNEVKKAFGEENCLCESGEVESSQLPPCGTPLQHISAKYQAAILWGRSCKPNHLLRTQQTGGWGDDEGGKLWVSNGCEVKPHRSVMQLLSCQMGGFGPSENPQVGLGPQQRPEVYGHGGRLQEKPNKA